MTRLLIVSAAALTLVTFLGDTASAQRRRRANRYRDRPAVSPYLNLFRGDEDPGFNYFRLVRPELEFREFNERQRRAFDQLEGEFGAIQGAFAESPPVTTLGGTGHPTYFMNYQGAYTFGRGGGRRAGRRPQSPERRFGRVGSRIPNVRGSTLGW